jgi:type VI protein secretion system component VasF
MRTDFFNEAIVTAMLAASSGNGEAAPQSGPEEENLARADALRERVLVLMDRAGRAAMQAGIPNDLVEAADFAVCAFIDELLLSSASWRGRLDWMKQPLQFTRHGTATAGEDFYRLLDGLLEEADRHAAFAPPGEVQNSAGPPVREHASAHNPLYAVLEIFALCLAQGFTGMLYGNPKAVRERLDSIGRFTPALSGRAAPIFFTPAEKAEEREVVRKGANLFRRFDLLDLGLWIVPLLLTALLYRVCETRLDRLLQPFVQGSVLP